MIEDLIKARKEKCIDALKQNHPELLRDGKFNKYKIEDFHINNAPNIALEAVAWDYFENERYWDGHNYVCKLLERNNEYFPEDDLKQITKLIIAQIMKGKMISLGIPLYSDTWRLFHQEPEVSSISSLFNSEAKPKISPLEKYVTEEDRAKAVNTGFWHTMNLMCSKKQAHWAVKEFLKIMDYNDFFGAFDYKKGAEESEKLSDNFDLHDDFNDWFTYMRWYLVQEYYVWAKFGREKAEEINSKLAAPLLEHLYYRRRRN